MMDTVLEMIQDCCEEVDPSLITEESRFLLPGYTAGIQDRAAPNTLFPGHVHGFLREACVYDHENYFMVIGRHGHSSLPSLLLLRN